MSCAAQVRTAGAAGVPRRTWLDDRGRSCLYALPGDQRFSYTLVLPPERATRDVGPRPLVVAVHGTERDATGTRDAFASLAAAHDVPVLAPLFPAGVDRDGDAGDVDDVDAYKLLSLDGIRFDEVLLAMVADVARRVGHVTDRLHLVGFSGGAQFALRFTYLHPERVAAVSVAAPGRVTLLDDRADWWQGTRDVTALVGRAVDLTTLRRVPVEVVVGSLDAEVGVSRVERARLLEANHRAHGLDVRLDVVPGARHELHPLVPAITGFLGDLLPPPGRKVECHPKQ